MKSIIAAQPVKVSSLHAVRTDSGAKNSTVPVSQFSENEVAE